MKYLMLIFIISCQKENEISSNQISQQIKTSDIQSLSLTEEGCSQIISKVNAGLIFQETAISSEYKVEITTQAVRDVLGVVPQNILNYWESIGGKVVLSSSFDQKCEDSVFSCLSSGEGGAVQIIVPYLKEENIWARPLLQRSILSGLGALHIEYLERFEEGDEGDWNLYFGPYLHDAMLFIANYVSHKLNYKKVIYESGFDLYPLLFTEYFCSPKSKSLLSIDLPDVSILFDQVFVESDTSLNLQNKKLRDATVSRSDSLRENNIHRETLDSRVEIEKYPDHIQTELERRSEELDVLTEKIFDVESPEERSSIILDEITKQNEIDTNITNLDSYADLYQPESLARNDRLESVQSKVGVKKSIRIGKFKLFSYRETKGLEEYSGPGRIIYSENLNVRTSGNQLNQKKPITITVHGTYGKESVAADIYKDTLHGDVVKGSRGWSNPDSVISKNLQKHYGGVVVAFQWSGNLKDKHRREAGSKLATEIVRLRNKGFEVNIVAHSHGANVAIDAINKLKEVSGKEDFTTAGEFVALGRPVREDYKLSDIKLLSYYVNVSGSKDFVQSIGGQIPKRFAKKVDDLAQTKIDFGTGVFIHNKLLDGLNQVLIHSSKDRASFAEEGL